METNEKYFNVPVQLLEGFFVDSRKSLNNVLDYAIYEHSKKLDLKKPDIYELSPTDRIIAAAKDYNVTLSSNQTTLKNGKILFDSIPLNSPKVGVKHDHYWSFYKEDKEQFEKACFLAYLALRSIVQNKPYCKIDNNYLLSRMDGKTHAIKEAAELSPEIRHFANDYQAVKIKKALQRSWGLVYYSRYTRGFYFSFTLTLEQLVFEAEKKRLSTWEKQNKHETDEARKKALFQLLR